MASTQVIPLISSVSPTLYQPGGVGVLRNLSQEETQVVLAKTNGTLIHLMSEDGLLELAANLMHRAKLRLNHSTDYGKTEQDKADMVLMFVSELRKFAALTDAEVRSAVAMGLNGDFEPQGSTISHFSVSAMVRWLRAYTASVKSPVMKKVARLEQDLVPELTLTLPQQNAMLLKGLLAEYRRMQQEPGYVLVDYGNAYYKFLEGLGFELGTMAEKKAIYAEETAKAKLGLTSYEDRMVAKSWLELLEANARKDSKNPLELTVITNCRKRLIKQWLLAALEMEVDLELLIEDKINPQ